MVTSYTVAGSLPAGSAVIPEKTDSLVGIPYLHVPVLGTHDKLIMRCQYSLEQPVPPPGPGYKCNAGAGAAPAVEGSAAGHHYEFPASAGELRKFSKHARKLAGFSAAVHNYTM